MITTALQRIPPALDILVKERPRITTALEKFGRFSDTATNLVNATRDDLLTNLRNLEPTVKALAVGPNLGTVLASAKQKDIRATASVVRAAPITVQSGTAEVLVYLNRATTSRDNPEPAQAASAVKVGLTKVDGNWLISSFTPI